MRQGGKRIEVGRGAREQVETKWIRGNKHKRGVYQKRQRKWIKKVKRIGNMKKRCGEEMRVKKTTQKKEGRGEELRRMEKMQGRRR